ncbi:metallophosphoesterase [Allomesorhizobium camelthorni]|uniref:Serine/threonine protein phosphatase n=1 Tax=Allomesorhizobium camelthorni TaxID=475069 RepID=A0A6G4WIY8_9HYPH|nr:metallophosphoesterase [Mesorhizobium camelthorni]NGO54569.1 serine/threonine protein phosphatase [Mesorhizobium camelthorni]
MPYTTYAIGDVHGRADLLEPLLAAISIEAETSGSDARVLFLGDIVDRGPASRQALNLVCDTLERWPKSQLIRGNHDAYFMDFMTAEVVDETRFTTWLLRLGGYDTLESYGLLAVDDIAEAAARFRAEFPRHVQALRNSLPIVADQRFAYVHAGIDPSRAMPDQDPNDLMMIRDRFLEYDSRLPHVFVHGHTPTKNHLPEFKRWRIGIDTRAYASGRLTCLAVSADERNLHLLFATLADGRVNITCERLARDRLPSLEDEVS